MLMNDPGGMNTIAVLKQALEKLPVRIFLLTMGSELLYANKAALAMIGHSRHEPPPGDVQKIFATFTPGKFSELTGLLYNNPEHQQTISAHINHVDGHQLACNLSLGVLQEGASQYILVSVTEEKTNDTQNKISEEKVPEKSLALLNVLERITDGFTAFDKDWNYTYINGHAAKTVGKTPEDLIGKNVWEIFPEIVGTPAYHLFQKAKQEQTVIHTTEYIETFQKWLEGTIYPSPDGLSVFFQEITEKKKAELALEEGEEMYRTIVETAHEGIWQIDAENRTTFVNNYLQALLGYAKDEMIGKIFLDFMSDSAKVEALALLEERKKGMALQHEFTFLRKDGTELHTLLQTSPVIRNGKYAGAVAMVLDISERRQAEEKLVASERRFRALFEYSQDGICLLSEEGIIINVSPSIEKVLELTKEELIGTKRVDYIHPDDVHIIYEAIRDIVKEPHKTKTVEYRVITQTNIEKWVEGNYTNLLSEPAIQAIVINFRDITERKITENKIKESEAKYRKAQSQGKLGHWELDTATNSLAWSDEIYTMFNVEHQIADLDYNKFLDSIHPDDREAVNIKIQKALSEKSGYEVSHRVILEDGSIRYVTNLAEVETNERGEVIKVVGMVQDVTAQKKHEQELSLSEQNYRLLFEKSPVPFWMVEHASFRFLEVNQAAIDLYGYSREEFLSMNVRDIRHDTYEANEIHHSYIIGKQNPQQNIIRHKKRNGQLIIVQLATNRIIFNNKVAWLVSTRDITQELLYEKQLQEKEQQLSVIFNSSVNGMALFGVDKQDQFRFEAVNDALCKGIRIEKEKVLGHLLSEIFHAKDIQHLLPGYKAAVATAEVQSFTAKSSQRVGNRLVEYTAIPIKDKSGKVVQLLSVSNDVTEKKKAEDELVKKNMELQELSAHLENIREEERIEIAREIHDELGQQLTGLKMEVSWLDRHLQDPDEKTLVKIQSCLGLIDAIIHTVRKIATTLRPSMLDYLGLAEALRWHAKEFNKHTGIVVSFISNAGDNKFSPLLSISVFRIFQEALTNVARHAKATSVQSSLTVGDGLLTLVVEDNGAGLPPGKADETKSTLGLVGMRERADLLKGSFSLSSEPGQGTTVKIEFPFN